MGFELGVPVYEVSAQMETLLWLTGIWHLLNPYFLLTPFSFHLVHPNPHPVAAVIKVCVDGGANRLHDLAGSERER